jgi:UDP-glucose 4,6-dehydratase
MKIFSIGAGFVSEHLEFPTIDSRLDFTSQSIEKMLEQYKPDTLINCIGKTGRPNVDWCESHREETAAINVALPILLAEACAKHSIHLIQISSGCIFFGESPNFHYVQADGSAMPDNFGGSFSLRMPTRKIDDGWKEDDFANPQSYYSKSKYACDLMLGQMPHVSNLRIRMPISSKNNPRNLINKLRVYKKIINIPNSMTFMDDLVKCVSWVAKNGHTGIFHVVNPEPLTATRIMKEYCKYVPDHTFDILHTEEELDKLTTAKRSNCILDSNKLKWAGFEMTPSEEALSQCMKQYVANIQLGNKCQTKI